MVQYQQTFKFQSKFFKNLDSGKSYKTSTSQVSSFEEVRLRICSGFQPSVRYQNFAKCDVLILERK